MSGTSLDGLDIALCDFSSTNILKASHFTPFPQELRQALFDLCHTDNIPLNDLYQTEQRYSRFCANAINAFLKQESINPSDLAALGLHGQTIRHEPNLSPAFTVQLGDWSLVAAETQITTIGDFRRKDVALGGQGAPLVPPFHKAIFSSTSSSRVIVNIGGISNVTILMPAAEPLGYDCGPGNALLDYWFARHHEGTFDTNGDWAKSGEINSTLLQRLLNDPFFMLPAPKSTGRELFNPEWLHSRLDDATVSLEPEEIQATLTELTAQSIAIAVKNHLNTGEVYVCGGGWKNQFLVERLKQALGESYTLASTEALGIHSDWVEACAFAWLAANTLHRQDSQQASTTGASRNAVLGGIYYP